MKVFTRRRTGSTWAYDRRIHRGMTLPSDSYPISQAGTQAAAAKTRSQETPGPELCALRRQTLSQKKERILARSTERPESDRCKEPDAAILSRYVSCSRSKHRAVLLRAKPAAHRVVGSGAQYDAEKRISAAEPDSLSSAVHASVQIVQIYKPPSVSAVNPRGTWEKEACIFPRTGRCRCQVLRPASARGCRSPTRREIL